MELNTIIHGNNADILPKIATNSIHLILTDPPYQDYQSNRPVATRKKKPVEEIMFNLEFFMEESFRVLDWGAHFYCFCNHHTFSTIQAEVKKHFTYMNCLVWVKNSHGSGDIYRDWAPQHEFIIYAIKGVGRHLNSPRLPNVFVIPRPPRTRTNHPTEKPVELLKRIIKASSNEGDTVLDPYAGSCSLAIACLESKRNFICIEIDPTYCGEGQDHVNWWIHAQRES